MLFIDRKSSPLAYLTLFICFVIQAGTAHAEVVFDRGANWFWRPGTNEASTPTDSWRLNGFNDSQFTSAPAPFWYGDVYAGGTQISGMQNVYLSIFLRKTFVVTNLSEISAVKLGAIVDDGFVAWINGTEVLRVNMSDPSGSPVTVNTLAINAVEPVQFTNNNLPPPFSYLVPGTNVIAVQVFQSALSSSDLGFDASLQVFRIETNAPVVVSSSPAANSTISSLSQLTVTFSEPVSGVDAVDLRINGSPAASVTPVNSSTYTFSFPQPAYGTVQVNWSPSHGIVDQAIPPNPFNANGSGAVWQYNLVDQTPPLVASLSPSPSSTVRSLTNITVLFSESVAGVNASDLLVNGTPATGLTTIAPNQYIIAFSQPVTGLVQVAWASAHGITDLASSANAFAGGNWAYNLDPNAVEGQPYISEFMAANSRTLVDENNEYSDWIEIYNPSALTVNLEGWYLTDSANNLTQWRFPATNLAGGGFMVVFASSKDRRIPGARLHTNFRLTAGGEYLALVRPDGVTIATEFRPVFPAQVQDISYGFAQFGNPPTFTAGTNGVYFTTPTPGAANLGGTTDPGPIIAEAHQVPNVPLDADDLIVTARVAPSFTTVASVTMRYRIMFDAEVTVPMFDDGTHGDGAAGDGIYGATIPASASTNGQMVRYYITATDVNSHTSRWPLYSDPAGTAQYLGTVVNPGYATSKLPIVYLFVEPSQQGLVDSQSGGRASVFHDGEFYDNVGMQVRGNTTAGLAKKSHRFEFNREHLFRHGGPGPRLRNTSFMADYVDPAYMRQGLAYWLCDQIGAPAPFYIPYRLEMNGQFYQLANHNDVHGAEMLNRLGYDPNGALYNAAGTCTPDQSSTGGFEKKTREWEPNTDYAQLAAAINESQPAGARFTNIFDMLDLPEVINYMVAARWSHENDDVWANMSLYHDNDGDNLWRIVPFDLNLSWGAIYYSSAGLEDGIQATNDNHKSFPLYGGSSALPANSGTWNRMYDVIFQTPQTREMFLRRMRTMLDTYILPPGSLTNSSPAEQLVLSWRDLIAEEADRDRVKWNWPAKGGQCNFDPGINLSNGVRQILQEFIQPRRQHFYGKHSVTNTALPIGISKTMNAGIPLTQPANVFLNIVGAEVNPVSGNQMQEFVCVSNPAPFAIDVSGWKLEGGVRFTFAPGTVIPANGIAYVSPNVRAFKARTVGPRGGQGLFVLGPYLGQLSARGEALSIINGFGQTINNFTYTGAPSPAQQFLRVTEIMYHPSPHAANTNAEEFEYVELRNISPSVTLNLAGIRFTNGIDFSFTGSAVTSLAPGARVLIVKNAAAFSARYGAGFPVAGQYSLQLNNNGERVQILDANDEEILDFTYDNNWYPITDGLGFSLVIVNENAQPDDWGNKSQWRPSSTLTGTPGVNEPAAPAFAPIIITEALSRTDNPPPVDSIEVYNPTTTNVNIGGWWLSDSFGTPKKFHIPADTLIPPGGYRVFTESDFNPGGLGFALGSDGDSVWIFSGDAAGNLTGYSHGFSFGGADDGVSFGRYVSSDGKEQFVAQTAVTLTTANAGPRVGPIVINELMYHPPDVGGTNDNSADEFVELLNISGSPVLLYDPALPTNTWKITGGIDLVFPTNKSIGPGEYVLVVNFDSANPALVGAFRAKYGVGANVQMFGPYGGKLGNQAEEVELKKPASPVLGVVPYVLIDKISYQDSTLWPAGADGTGLSLQRRNSAAFGNDPANWTAAPATAAAATPSGTAPGITAQPVSQTLVAYQNGALSVTATGAPSPRYQWRLNGSAIAGATNSILQLTSIQPFQMGNYDVVVFNSAGSIVSSNASLNLSFPPLIITQPQSVQVRVRPDPQAPASTNVTFSVTGYAPGGLTYQWRFNGINIPGATGPSLTITNVQGTNSGDYTAVISDGVASASSATATLSALITPSIIQPPLSQTVVVGAPVTLSVGVSGSPFPITYQWRRVSTIVATHSVNSLVDFYSFTAPTTVGVTQYRVVVTNLAYGGLSTNALITLTTLADTDGDGIPDEWETANFGSATGAVALGDPDGDGMSNWQEYIAGTNPTNASSYLKIDAHASPGAGISFSAVSNHTYTVQYTDALQTGAWQKFAQVLARPTNHIEVIQDPGFTTNRFYRLVTPGLP
ncbi:MAG: Spore coat protein CotH [Verrucomicrobiales bacterium]|nr:Spore coat protein CotH [Verrucomicrobiales bacterium]